jgi:hypothetical protein
MHYGVKGMKWGVRRNRLQSAVSKQIKKRLESNSERFKDQLASRDPISKKRREQAKERQKRRDEMLEITQAKGKAKVAKILKKIGNDLLNPVIVDGPSGPKRQPWDEKPSTDHGGRI